MQVGNTFFKRCETFRLAGFITTFPFTVIKSYCYQTFRNQRNLEISHRHMLLQGFEPLTSQLSSNHSPTELLLLVSTSINKSTTWKKNTNLKRVSDESRRPTFSEPSRALLANGHLEPVDDILVLVGVHLQPALHKIEGHNRRMRYTYNCVYVSKFTRPQQAQATFMEEGFGP